MKTFISTCEFTQDIENNEIQSCQVLGWAKEKIAQEAFDKLIKANLF